MDFKLLKIFRILPKNLLFHIKDALQNEMFTNLNKNFLPKNNIQFVLNTLKKQPLLFF